MTGWALILLATGALSLIVLVGHHVWHVPRRAIPLLLFTGFGGILAGMGLFALSLMLG